MKKVIEGKVKKAEQKVEEKVESLEKDIKEKKEKKEKKPARKRNIPQEVYIQFAGKEIAAKDIIEKAKEDYVKKGNKESSIKLIQLYVKPEENAAYCVINGDSSNEKIDI